MVVIAASAGGFNPLITIITALPADLPAAVMVVQHRTAQLPFELPALLGRCSLLKVRAARDGDNPVRGTVLVCPPGMHMEAEAARAVLRVMYVPALVCARPSADLMLYSAAQMYGRGCVGVVLSGTGMDGAFGSRAIVDAGGTVIAQSPDTCAFPSMPQASATLGPAQLVLPPEAIAPALVQLLHAEMEEPSSPLQRAERGGSDLDDGTIRVLLADDHQMIREGLHALLRAAPNIVVVGAVTNGREAVAAAFELTPDIVIMDLAMPELDGVEATRQIRRQNPAVKVIMLSAQTDLSSIGKAFEAGVVGFLSKQKAFDELLQAIRTVATTGEYVNVG